MRILFTIFLMLFFLTAHSVVDDSHLFATNTHISADTQDVKQARAPASKFITPNSHTSNCIQNGSGIGHFASSCLMDSRTFASVIRSKNVNPESIIWYLQFNEISQEYSEHLLRPPII